MDQRARPTPLVIVAILTPRIGFMELFQEYEAKAARMLARYGGVIERTVAEEVAEFDKPVREVHVVRFPDAEAFDRYRADPDLASLKDMRAASIAHTEILVGHDGPNYMSFSRE